MVSAKFMQKPHGNYKIGGIFIELNLASFFLSEFQKLSSDFSCEIITMNEYEIFEIFMKNIMFSFFWVIIKWSFRLSVRCSLLLLQLNPCCSRCTMPSCQDLNLSASTNYVLPCFLTFWTCVSKPGAVSFRPRNQGC